jgi:hypothetical protein
VTPVAPHPRDEEPLTSERTMVLEGLTVWGAGFGCDGGVDGWGGIAVQES